MSILSSISAWFRKTSGLIVKGLAIAVATGLKDDVVGLALKWVKVASAQTIEKAEKREYVVRILVSKGVPEGIARIAIELAYGIYKDELDKLDIRTF